MNTGLGWYKEHGRKYSVNTCNSCGAAVTITPKQMEEIRLGRTYVHGYFDDNIPCCDNPNFRWIPLA